MTTFLIKVIHFISQPFWIRGKYSSFTPKCETSKEIEVDISIFWYLFVLSWRMLKHLSNFVSVSIFNPQFFKKNVFQDFNRGLCCFFPNSSDTLRLAGWKYWNWTFYVSRNAYIKFFQQPYPCVHKALSQRQVLCICNFINP